MKRVLLATCYFKHNFGSMLQAYATQCFLDKKNIFNKTIDISSLKDFRIGKIKYYKTQMIKPSFFKAKRGMIKLLIKRKIEPKMKANFTIRDSYFDEFKKNKFNLTDSFESYNDLHNFCIGNFNNVLVGSDQLWLPINIVANYYTLNFVPKNINKISYATSFGVSSIPNKLKNEYSSFLRRIDNISVREESGEKIIEELIGKKCEVVCDPTLLLTSDEWRNLAPKKRIIDCKYIFCYFLGKSKAHRKFAETVKEITGYKIVSINNCDEYVKYSEKYADIVPYDVGPLEWINLIMNSEYVCTDSFHGTLFSLIFNKIFFTFRRFSGKTVFSTNTRIDTILNIVNLHKRIFTGEETHEEIIKILNTNVDYDTINIKLDEYRKKSGDFLINSIR